MTYVLLYYSKKRVGQIERLRCDSLSDLVKEAADMTKRGFILAGAE